MAAPPFVTVGQAHKAWAEIGASDWLVRQLRFGLQLPWRRKPPRSTRIRSYNLSPADLGFACAEVRRWMTAGFCRVANAADLIELRQRGHVSPAFVTSTAQKLRLVIDYTVVNECIEARTFRMDQLSDLAPTLRREDCLFKADIKDAYYHLRLRKEDQHYLAFSVGGVVYVPACLNCGLAVAPWFFTKAMRPVVSYLRAKGHRVFSYLDDFFGAGATPRNDHPATEADTARLETDMRSLFARLGLTLHPTKCDFAGSQSLEILGILVDTRRAQFLLAPEKLRKVEGAARRLLAHARTHRRYVSARALRSFAGLGNSTGLAVVDARLRLRELFDALSLAGRQDEMSELGTSAEERSDGAPSGNSDISSQPARVATPPEVPPEAAPQATFFARGTRRALCARQPRISHAGMRDLRWWASLSDNPHVGRTIWPAPTATMFTDASMSGWGAVWNGKVPASGFFDAANEGSSINELELLAAIHGLRAFATFARSRELTLVSDSLVTVNIVRNWTSRAPRLLSHLRTLRALCETLGVTISTRHLPSVLNLWADRLSRRRDSTSWGLPPTSTLLLVRRYGAQSMDGDGLPPPRAGAYGRPAFVLPRPGLLPVWHRHLAGITRGFMIAPEWRGQAWFQQALRCARVTPLSIPATPPWPSVILDYGRPPALPPEPGNRLG
jgi:ribonuclease HI